MRGLRRWSRANGVWGTKGSPLTVSVFSVKKEVRSAAEKEGMLGFEV